MCSWLAKSWWHNILPRRWLAGLITWYKWYIMRNAGYQTTLTRCLFVLSPWAIFGMLLCYHLPVCVDPVFQMSMQTLLTPIVGSGCSPWSSPTLCLCQNAHQGVCHLSSNSRPAKNHPDHARQCQPKPIPAHMSAKSNRTSPKTESRHCGISASGSSLASHWLRISLPGTRISITVWAWPDPDTSKVTWQTWTIISTSPTSWLHGGRGMLYSTVSSY